MEMRDQQPAHAADKRPAHETHGAGNPESYRAFGLRIASELALPGLVPTATRDPADIEIRFGDVPPDLPGATKRGVRYQSAPGALRIQADGVASYLVTEGRNIVIDRADGADDADVLALLLASPLAAALQQRGDLVLHGSAILWENSAVGFLGPSGIGKSTLANAFRLRGYPMLTDDLCVVRTGADGVPQVFPGLPHTKLWPDALRQLDIAADGLARVRSVIEKRIVSVAQDFTESPVPLRRLYVLRAHGGPEIELLPLKGLMKFSALKNLSYRFGFLPDTASQAKHFREAFRIAERTPLIAVRRPSGSFNLDALVERIETDLRT